jgi:hypothetical protein
LPSSSDSWDMVAPVATSDESASIGFYAIHAGVIWKGQDQSRSDKLFEFVKGSLFLLPPFPVHVLLREVEQRAGVIQEPFYEVSVEAVESKERLYFLFVVQNRPFHHSRHLYWVHLYFPFQYDESQVFNQESFELTFLRSEVEFVFLESLHYSSDHSQVFHQCLGEDEDVIQVHTDHSFHDEVSENVIHHGLEGGRAVHESKEHNQWFKQSSVCPECCLALISVC